MSTFVGSKDTKAVMVGTKEVSAVYVGAQQIWPDGPPPIPEVLEMSIQLIGGGGGTYPSNPNGYAEGGGGGGGFRQEINIKVQPNVVYPIAIGAGGAASLRGNYTTFDETGGLEIKVAGGGSSHKGADYDGGGGGGGRAKASKGYDGGAGGLYGCAGGTSIALVSAGGGGVGSQPVDCTAGHPSPGGAGLQCYDLITRAGGGGAGAQGVTSAGNNGGGNGGTVGKPATPGSNNTGGGGGGGFCNGTDGTAAQPGGSGTVLIKTTWKDVTLTGTVVTTALESGETVYKWNNSGSIRFNQQ